MFNSKTARSHYKRLGYKLIPKIGFDSITEARKHDRRTNRGVYLCDFCGKYHVGRNSKRAE